MRASTLVMIGFAVLFGLLAVFLAQSWLNNTADARMRSLEAAKKPIATQTIVVAGKPLRYGNELSAQALREIPLARGGTPGRCLRPHQRNTQGRQAHRADGD